MKVLTVAIAAYNVDKYIRQALNSFCEKDVLDRVEVFIIDDGGSDATMVYAQEYAQKYPDTFKLVHKENGGWGSTINTGIELATGKYFKNLDGDDYFNKKNLPIYLDELEHIDADVVYTRNEVVDDATGRRICVDGDVKEISSGILYAIDDVGELLNFSMHVCTFKTSILQNKNLKVSEHCFYTDNEYIIKAIAHMKTVYILDKTLYCYRVGRNGQSVSLEGIKRNYRDYECMLKNVMQFYDDLDDVESKNRIHKYIHIVIDATYFVYGMLGMRMAAVNFDRWLLEYHSQFYESKSKKIKLMRDSKFYFVGILHIETLIREWLRKHNFASKNTAFN